MRAHAVLSLAVGLIAFPAHALTPEQIFEKVSPSVWFVYGQDATGRRLGQGSGVVIGPERVVTNCHVLARARTVSIEKDNIAYRGTLEHADAERDLCSLAVRNFKAPAVETADFDKLKAGQRVYAIGNPKGLELTISDGLISGLRAEQPNFPPIQTTAPISPGSSGGGLFDAEGRLIGITTGNYAGRDQGQNLNFAIPASWIAELPERAKAALEARKARPARGRAGEPSSPQVASGTPASTELPLAGSLFSYSWRDRSLAKAPVRFQVSVANVDGWTISESVNGRSRNVDAQQTSFGGLLIEGGGSIVEFSPYLSEERQKSIVSGTADMRYPSTGSTGFGPWTITVVVRGAEQVSVPGGSYRAQKIELRGERQYYSQSGVAPAPTRFVYEVWYSPEVRRYIRARHQQWDRFNSVMGDDEVELVEFKKP